MRADRLLSLVLLPQHRGRMSAAALARELEVSTRTVLRDVETLSTAGVPVYAERGRRGGFALLPGYSTDLTGLTSNEAVALLVAGSRAASPDPGMASALAPAMRKVRRGAPAAAARQRTCAAGRILVRRDGLIRRREPSADDEARLDAGGAPCSRVASCGSGTRPAARSRGRARSIRSSNGPGGAALLRSCAEVRPIHAH